MRGPKVLYWVEMKLSGDPIPYAKMSARVRGGKRSSLRAARDAKKAILAADPRAEVRIYEARVHWIEVTE